MQHSQPLLSSVLRSSLDLMILVILVTTDSVGAAIAANYLSSTKNGINIFNFSSPSFYLATNHAFPFVFLSRILFLFSFLSLKKSSWFLYCWLKSIFPCSLQKASVIFFTFYTFLSSWSARTSCRVMLILHFLCGIKFFHNFSLKKPYLTILSASQTWADLIIQLLLL